MANSVWRVACFVALALLSTLALDSQRPARADGLYIMNSDGANLRQLVRLIDHPSVGSPMWSRDGKHVYFDAWRPKEGSRLCHTYRVNADGTWPVDLGLGAMPSPDPAGIRGIATHLYDDQAGIWLGKKDKALVDGDGLIEPDAGSPRWHPHETKLAYVKWSGGIWMRDLSGPEPGDEELVVPAEFAPYVGYSWAPDGKAIAFYSNRKGANETELLVLNVAEKGHQPEVKDSGKIGWILSWSPDGKKIAYSNFCQETGTRQVMIADPGSDARPYRLAGQVAERNNGGPAWSPDGKQIVFGSSAVVKQAAEKEVEKK
jgi:Tol biopolymer transport system component